MKNIYQKLHAIPDPSKKISFPPLRNAHIQDVLQRCLQRRPERRPTIPELLRHSLLNPDAAPAAPPVRTLARIHLSPIGPCRQLMRLVVASERGSVGGELAQH